MRGLGITPNNYLLERTYQLTFKGKQEPKAKRKKRKEVPDVAILTAREVFETAAPEKFEGHGLVFLLSSL